MQRCHAAAYGIEHKGPVCGCCPLGYSAQKYFVLRQAVQNDMPLLKPFAANAAQYFGSGSAHKGGCKTPHGVNRGKNVFPLICQALSKHDKAFILLPDMQWRLWRKGSMKRQYPVSAAAIGIDASERRHSVIIGLGLLLKLAAITAL